MTYHKLKCVRIFSLTSLLLLLSLQSESKLALSQTVRWDKWQDDIPNFAFHSNSRGVEYVKKGLKYREQKQDDRARAEFNKALRSFRDAIKQKSDYYAAHFNLALAYYLRNGEGGRQRSLDTFGSAVKIAESQKIKDPALYNAIGKIHFEALNYEQAERNFRKSLEIDKGYAEAVNNLAAVYERKGDIKAAVDQYQKASSLGNPRAGENYQRLSPLEKK